MHNHGTNVPDTREVVDINQIEYASLIAKPWGVMEVRSSECRRQTFATGCERYNEARVADLMNYAKTSQSYKHRIYRSYMG